MSAGFAASTAAPRGDLVQRFSYVPVLAAAMGLMMARLLVLAKLLPVHEFSALGIGLLVSNTFCMVGCLGLQQLLQRQWPVSIVRGQEMPGLVLAAQCSLVALACLAMAVVGIVLGAPMAAAGAGLVALGALHGFTQQVFLVASAESRSRGDALRYAWQNMTRSVLASVLGIGAALYTGSAAWILAVEVLAAAMQSASMFHRSVRRASAALGEVFRLAVRQLPGIDWRAALTMMLVAALSFLMINADRWVAADRLDVHGFGLYSFAWIVLLVAQGVQAVLNASIFPLLARTRGSGGGRAVFAICCRWSALLLGAGLLAALGAWWLLDMAISRWFLPYQQALAVVPVLLLVAVLRVSDFWSSYLLVVGREGSLLVVNALAALASIGTWCLLVRPWAGALTLQQVSWLAAAFAVIGYVAVAGAAWRARSA